MLGGILSRIGSRFPARCLGASFAVLLASRGDAVTWRTGPIDRRTGEPGVQGRRTDSGRIHMHRSGQVAAADLGSDFHRPQRRSRSSWTIPTLRPATGTIGRSSTFPQQRVVSLRVSPRGTGSPTGHVRESTASANPDTMDPARLPDRPITTTSGCSRSIPRSSCRRPRPPRSWNTQSGATWSRAPNWSGPSAADRGP